ncbi:Ig-like domain (group 2) [Lachnospiraceae bacterium KH1T2]|nr:Ig-like domain (group 2) [Lachnospiraceae bacterium KH1T2]
MKRSICERMFAVLCCFSIMISSKQPVVNAKEAVGEPMYLHGSVVKDIYTDKAIYSPKDTVLVSLNLTNNSGKDIVGGKISLRPRHLSDIAGDEINEKLDLETGQTREIKLKWKAPADDFTGYMLEADVYDGDGQIVDTSAVAADISSSWVKFPRYGYLYDFGEKVDTAQKIEEMNRFHINGIEYYDWQFRHHEPLPKSSTSDDLGSWDDWSGRTIYGNTIQNYIRNAHEKNMVNMAYDMIYAGTDDFFKDDPEAEKWKIKHKDSGDDFMFTMGDSPSGNGHLYFLNPLNADWQNHLFSEINRAITTVGFDGYHGDTVGDWGDMTDYEGAPLGRDEKGNAIYSVTGTYKSFLNACKDSLPEGKYLSFNPVGAKGIQEVNKSRTDVLYTEFWPWDSNRHGDNYSTLYSLVREAEDSMNDSKAFSIDGKGKSLVEKAYINYTSSNKGRMNPPAVLLTEAAVFAAGGSRLEIGNGYGMLHHEYYPNDLEMTSAEFKDHVESMYNFLVAYENILRDGQSTTDNDVEIPDVKVSKDGEADTIWTYSRKDDKYEILHLINLLGTDNEWRDTRCSKKKPVQKNNIRVRYYNSQDINAVYLASPDIKDGRSRALNFIKGNDGKDYIEFTVPSLEYWDMVYMSKEKGTDLIPGEGTTEINTESFRIEGENAELVGTGGDPSVGEDLMASNRKYIHDIGAEQGYAVFTVPDGVKYGKYTVRLRYSSGTDGRVSVKVNDTEYVGKYRATDRDWKFRPDTLEIRNVIIKAGDEIRIQDLDSDCYIWIDRLSGELTDPMILPKSVEKEPDFKLESESGELVPCGGNPVVQDDDMASGGKFVHDIGLSQGSLNLVVPANVKKGKYNLRICYSSSTDGEVSVTADGRKYKIGYERTNDNWAFWPEYLELSDVVLQGGSKIRISDARDDCWIWVDFISGYLNDKVPEEKTSEEKPSEEKPSEEKPSEEKPSKEEPAVDPVKDSQSVNGLDLQEKRRIISVGSSADLKVNVSPENADNSEIRWCSSDDSIVSVCDGKITGIKEGDAIVTVQAGSVSDACRVSVIRTSKDAVPNRKLGISISSEYRSVRRNKKIKVIDSEYHNILSADVTEATTDRIRWVSDNDNVIEIGSVEGNKASLIVKRAGNATITCICGSCIKNVKLTAYGNDSASSSGAYAVLKKGSVSIRRGKTSSISIKASPLEVTNDLKAYIVSDDGTEPLITAEIKNRKLYMTALQEAVKGSRYTVIIESLSKPDIWSSCIVYVKP